MFFPLMADTWGDEEVEAIQGVIESGQYTMAGNVARFENAFAAYHGRAFAVMVNSGSSANLIAVAALRHHGTRGLRRGDEIIVPAVSWSTTFFPLQQYGLRLRFVDVDPGHPGHGREPPRRSPDAPHPRHRRRQHLGQPLRP